MIRIAGLVLCLSLALAGCATIKVEAPRNQQIVLQSNVDSQPLVAKKMVWFALFGLVPISDNSTAQVAKDNNLKELSAKSYYSFTDYLISFFTSYVTVGVKTLEIHGK